MVDSVDQVDMVFDIVGKVDRLHIVDSLQD